MQTLIATQPSINAITHISQSGQVAAYQNLRKESDRTKVRMKLEAMLWIETLMREGLSQKNAIIATAKKYNKLRGFSNSKLAADYNLWRNGGQKQNHNGLRTGLNFNAGDWRMFLPNYTNGNANAALQNPEFVQFIQRLFADTCRHDATGAALHERLLDKYFAGEHIPGYGTMYQICAKKGRPIPHGRLARSHPDNYPDGWSPENLRRMLPKSQAKKIYLQRGEHAAHSHWGDQLLRDRSKLMPFQLVTFDDVRFDIKVIQPMPGKAAQVVYPEAIFCLDVATGMILAKAVVGSYMRHTDSDGGRAGTKRGFQHADMRWLMAKVLEQYGTPQDWRMRVLLENASASMSNTDQLAFEQLTGIEFETTGLIRSRLTASGFVEQGGMPWQKGWIEAFFRLMHTAINHLPGTVGRRYDLTDGRQMAGEKYTLKQLKDAHDAGIAINELKLPLLTIDEFHSLLDEYVERLNWRTRHNLQGFEQVHDFEYATGQFIRHDDPRAAQLITVGTQLRSRMEAPVERFKRLMLGHRMQPAHPRQLYPLMLEKRPVTVRSDRVLYKINNGDDLHFRDADTAHLLADWNGRKKALIGFLSTDRSQIHLFTNDENLTYICSPRNMARIDITDEHAILKRSGEVHQGREKIRQYAADLCADKEIQLADMRAHNNRLLGQSDHIAESIQSAESATRTKRAKSTMSDAEADDYFNTAAAQSKVEQSSYDENELNELF